MIIPPRCFSSLKSGDIIHLQGTINPPSDGSRKWKVYTISGGQLKASSGILNTYETYIDPSTFSNWKHIRIVKKR